MKQVLLMIVVVVLVGCGENRATSEWKEEKAAEAKAEAEAKEQSAIVEKAIRRSLNKPTGELTKADLEKVTYLNLGFTKITDASLKEVAKMKQLKELCLFGNKITDAGLREVAKLQQLTKLTLDDTKVTKEGIAQLRKALPGPTPQNLRGEA